MNYLITGGAGFIGTNLCRYLKGKAKKIFVIDNFSAISSKNNLKVLQGLGYVDLIKHDLRNPNIRHLRHLKDIDVIIHLAASCSSSLSVKDPYFDFLCNALATVNVLEYSRNHGKIPVIYASTCKVYSTKLNEIGLKEKKFRYDYEDIKGVDEYFPIDGFSKYSHAPYGCSKYAGDLYCQEYFASYGIPVIVNRMSAIFGFHQHGTEEAGWVYHFVKSKKEGKKITIFGTGKQVRDCLWVSDLCNLFYKQAQKVRTVKERIYNVGGGSGNAISLRETVNYLDKTYGGKMQIEYKDERIGDLKVYISDIEKVRKAFNWEPKVDVFEGIDRLYKSI